MSRYRAISLAGPSRARRIFPLTGASLSCRAVLASLLLFPLSPSLPLSLSLSLCLSLSFFFYGVACFPAGKRSRAVPEGSARSDERGNVSSRIPLLALIPPPRLIQSSRFFARLHARYFVVPATNTPRVYPALEKNGRGKNVLGSANAPSPPLPYSCFVNLEGGRGENGVNRARYRQGR